MISSNNNKKINNLNSNNNNNNDNAVKNITPSAKSAKGIFGNKANSFYK